MSEFTPINTQEELDNIIKERLTRDREAQSKKYSDYEDLKKKVTEYEGKIKEYTNAMSKYDEQLKGIAEKDKEIESLKGQVKTHEINALKAKIAKEVGLPAGFSARLSGEDEKTIKEDAKALKAVFDESAPKIPGVSREPAESNEAAAKRAGLQAVLNGLKAQGGI